MNLLLIYIFDNQPTSYNNYSLTNSQFREHRYWWWWENELKREVEIIGKKEINSVGNYMKKELIYCFCCSISTTKPTPTSKHVYEKGLIINMHTLFFATTILYHASTQTHAFCFWLSRHIACEINHPPFQDTNQSNRQLNVMSDQRKRF